MFKYYYLWIPLCLVVGLAIIIPIGVTQYNNEVIKDYEDFVDISRTYTGFVSRTVMGSIINGGKSMKDLYTLKPEMTRDEHLTFSKDIYDRYTYISTFGFAKRVFNSDRQTEEDLASVYFDRNVSITDPKGNISPIRDVYYPTTIQYPYTNTTRIMVDRTLTKFFSTLNNSIGTGEDSITDLLYFPFSDSYSHIIYHPIYNTSSITESERIMNYIGSVGTVFDLRFILVDRIKRVTTRQAGFFVFDNKNEDFIAGVCGDSGSWIFCTPESVNPSDVIVHNISVVDATWRVEVVKLGDFVSYRYYLIFSIGLPILFLSSVTISIVFYSMYNKIEYTNNLIESNKKIEETKQQFIHYIFHEIRIPFQTIKLGINNLRKYLPSEDNVYNIWSAIDDSVTHASRILNDMLDFGKMEKGQFNLSESYTCINISTTLLLAGYESEITGKNIKFTTYIHPDIDTHLFYCDIGRLNQCINNLLSNANKFTTEGSIEFKIDIIDRIISDPDIWTIRVSVKDTGLGISEKDQEKLFKAYQQIENQSHEVGTGLGLTIVKNIVGLHKGELGCNSEVDKGSEFWFTIPLQVIRKPENYNSEPEEKLSDVPQEILNHTILIVDDNKTNCDSFGEYLRNLGFNHIEYAYNGIQALEKIDEHGLFDIIFMDYNMPNMDGVECAKEIKKRYKDNYKSYITMVTGAYVDFKYMYDIGIDTVLQKPLDLSKLNKTMHDIKKKYNKDKEES